MAGSEASFTVTSPAAPHLDHSDDLLARVCPHLVGRRVLPVVLVWRCAQSNKCPICRAPFHSLLQIRVIRPKVEGEDEQDNSDSSEDEEDKELAPPGFKLVSLVTAVTEEDTHNGSSAAVEDDDANVDTPDESQGCVTP